MKSKLFKDTQGLDRPFALCSPDKISVCMRIHRRAYDLAVAESEKIGITSGEYIERLILEKGSTLKPAPEEALVFSGVTRGSGARR